MKPRWDEEYESLTHHFNLKEIMTVPGTRPKLLHIALGLMLAPMPHIREGKDQPTDYDVGRGLKYYLDNYYRRSDGKNPSRAAHYKRLAKKRKNIRARGKK